MKTYGVILLWLGVWWMVSAILCARRMMSKESRESRRELMSKPQPTTSPKRYGPRMPNWEECMASPSTFILTFFVTGFVLLQVAIVFLLLWPNYIIHWFFYGRIVKR
jgi:hypothetical protein